MHSENRSSEGLRGHVSSVAARAVEREWPVALAFAAILLGLWQAMDLFGVLPEYVLGPAVMVAAAIENIDSLQAAVGPSLKRVVAGFVLGSSLGVVLGLAASVVRLVGDIIEPLVSMTYPLPKIALFPVMALWLGFTDSARILLLALACFYPVFVNAFSGTRGIDRTLMHVAANAGVGKWEAIIRVVLPAAMPRIIVGLRIGLATTMVLVFAAEAVAPSVGLGDLVFRGYQGANYELMYTAILAFAVLGFVADRLILWIGIRLTHGQDLAAAGRG